MKLAYIAERKDDNFNIKKIKTLIRRGIFTSMFIAALLAVAKIWQQPKCSLTDDWIKKIWYIYIYIYIHTHIYYIYIHIYTYIYIYIYTHTHNAQWNTTQP